MKKSKAKIVAEYGPYEGAARVNGVTYDGQKVWFASDDRLNAVDPESGKLLGAIDVAARAGTAFDGKHLYQIAKGRIQKINPTSGRVLSSIPAPSVDDNSGLAWAEGSLWVGQADARKILQLDPQTGKVLRSIPSERIVTGVTWVEGELWHATWEDNNESDLRRVDPKTGEVLEKIELPDGVNISGLESDGRERFFCGGGGTGKLRVIRRPGRRAAAGGRTAADGSSDSSA
jgi:outer membrane protein assembly factor BamB